MMMMPEADSPSQAHKAQQQQHDLRCRLSV